jgi:O-antigen/teichoic acid export membrane protein
MTADEPRTSARTRAAPSLLQSGAFSLATSAAPLLVALIALPLLTRQLGTERLGLLTLAWAWLGYAAMLDFGLGRALTRLVASSDAGEPYEHPVGAVIATAQITLTVVGLVVGVLGAVLAPWYITSVLHVSDALRSDAVISAVLFALTVPAVTGASAPRAVLEARQQFRDVNLIRLPVSVGTFAVPLLLLPFTASLTVIAATLAAVRAWAWWRYNTLARRVMPSIATEPPLRSYLRPLFRVGAWMTVSNVLTPLMTVADRFLIGALMSVGAVALYAVPWEAVMKLWIVAGALEMVLFPALSRVSSANPAQLIPLHLASVRLLTLIVVPMCAIASLLAPWLLQVVGGRAYAGDSVIVLRVLAIGVAANSIAMVPYTVLQATGRAKWTAMLHMCEILPYAALLVLSVQRWGIVGAAGAWTVRMLIDALILASRAQVVAPLPASGLLVNIGGVAVVALCAAVGVLSASGSVVPLVMAAAIAAAAPVVLWTQRSDAERMVLERAGGAGA